MRSFLRCDLRLQLLGDWLLTLAPRPHTSPPDFWRAPTRLGAPPTASFAGPSGRHPNGHSAPSADQSLPHPTLANDGTPSSFPLGALPHHAGAPTSDGPGYGGASGQNGTAGLSHNGNGGLDHNGTGSPSHNGTGGLGHNDTDRLAYDDAGGPGYNGPGYNGAAGPGHDKRSAADYDGSSAPGSDRWFADDRSSLTSTDAATPYDGSYATSYDSYQAAAYDGPHAALYDSSHAASRDGTAAAAAERYSAPAECDPDPLAWPQFASSPAVVQIELPPGPRHLIALVALNGRCARTHAAATLWPDCTDAVAASRLRAVLWRLRHRHAGVPPLLDIGDSSLALNPEVVVDVHGFRQSAELLIRPHNDNDEAEQAAHAVLHASELLPGWYDDWVLAARERLQYQRLSALDALAARRRRQRRTHEALEAARAAIAIEPLHESAHRTIVETHLDNGDIVEAIQHYQRFQAMLDRELGLPPSALFREVVEPYLAMSSHKVVRTS